MPHRPSTTDATPEGVLLVHKPRGVTSHDVVAAVRRKLGVRRVGHTGTLDPMAEGLLVILVGRATKQQQAYQGHDKSYDAVLRLGTQTDTGDATGAVIRTAPVPVVTRERLVDVLASCESALSQVPPAYSAVKVRGRPAYWWARRRQPVVLAARPVRIHRLTLRDAAHETLSLHVECSAGTYIRALSELIAERLGTVGHLEQLVRVRIGAWRLEQARPLAWIGEATPEAVLGTLMPLSAPRAAQVG